MIVIEQVDEEWIEKKATWNVWKWKRKPKNFQLHLGKEKSIFLLVLINTAREKVIASLLCFPQFPPLILCFYFHEKIPPILMFISTFHWVVDAAKTLDRKSKSIVVAHEEGRKLLKKTKIDADDIVESKKKFSAQT